MWKAYANAGETKLRLAKEHRERGRAVRRQSSQHADKMKNIAYFLGQINKGLPCSSYIFLACLPLRHFSSLFHTNYLLRIYCKIYKNK